THSGDKECPHCKRKLSGCHYDRHLAAHAREHVCTHCQKRFKNATNLKRHLDAVHPQGSLLKCSKCVYSTRSKQQMKKHAVKKHRDERRRVCEECADSFRTLGAYLVHRRQHARAREKNESPQTFRCPHCRASFNARLARTAHMSHCGRRRHANQQGRGADDDDWESEFALDGAATIYRARVEGDVETKVTSVALIANKAKMLRKLTEQARALKGLKFWLSVRVGATRETAKGLEEEEKHLRSQNHIVLAGETGERQLEQAILQTVESADNMITEGGSSWQITAVYFIEMNVVEYAPLAASSYIPLPKALRNSKLGIINIKNDNDAECFRWCVLAVKFPPSEPRAHAERIAHYRPYYNELKFGKLESENFKISDIPKFEKLNPEFSFTVVTVNNAKTFYPMYASYEEAETHVTLLHFSEKNKSHYAVVKSLDTLLYSTTAHKSGKYFCKFCFNKFLTDEKRNAHEALCRENGPQKSKLPAEGSTICFDTKLYNKTQRSEFVGYFDFECRMVEVNETAGKKTRKTMKHVPVCYVIIITDYKGDLVCGPFTYFAEEGVVQHFINKVLEIEDYLFKNKKEYPVNMSHAQYVQFDNTFECELCGRRFASPAEKIIDHEHFIEYENYRSALHGYGPEEEQQCNALRRRSNILTMISHNGIKYDSVLVWKGAIEHPALEGREIKVIPRTKSSYLSFTIYLDDGRGVTFIDSFRHVMGSLESLAQSLAPQEMRVLRACFKNDVTRPLLEKKGIYPYEYVRRFEQYEETKLPSIEDFFSSLSECTITQEEYSHANAVFNAFECKNLKDYTLLYCVCDCALLCDIFSSYRRTTYETFQLEPCKFVSGASLSFACALKKTRLRIENITCPDQFAFIERSVRGGQSFISARYLKANNEFCEDYDSSQPKTFLSVFDLTALYTGAMRSSLPCGEYQWVDQSEYAMGNLREDDEYCYYWEIDATYPAHLHEAHRDYPLAPEKLHITEQMLSPAQKRLLAVAGRELPKKDVKLVGHFGDRRNYVCHALLLQEYVARGLVVTRVHRGLKFRQAPILKPYMDYLVQKRAAATTDFQQMYFKGQGNSSFGYCLKSNRGHINVKIVRSRRKLKKLTKSPFFHSFTIFGSDLIAVQMKQAVLKLDYPVIVGASILEKSKLTAFRTYFALKDALGPTARCAFHDTDSWAFLYRADSIEEGYKKIAHLMDFSNLPPSHPMYNTSRKKVPLYLKDEYPLAPLHSFVGIRAKNYAFKYCTSDGKDVKKCKGIQKSAVRKHIKFEDYKRCIFENYEKAVTFSYIRDDGKQNMYTWEAKKSALCNFDSKRRLCANGTDTVPYFYEVAVMPSTRQVRASCIASLAALALAVACSRVAPAHADPLAENSTVRCLDLPFWRDVLRRYTCVPEEEYYARFNKWIEFCDLVALDKNISEDDLGWNFEAYSGFLPVRGDMVGGSQSGKTTLVLDVLQHRHRIIDGHIKNFYWALPEDAAVPQAVLTHEPSFNIIRGPPVPSDIERDSLVVVDDLGGRCQTADIAKLFTVTSHHSRNSHLFSVLCTASPARRVALLRTLTREEVLAVCEVILNAISKEGGCPLGAGEARKCERYKGLLRDLAYSKKIGWKGKKKLIVQKGRGAWLVPVLSALLAFAS
ncbi:Transcription factor E4F1, partial [Frankliniella fusca]